MMPELGKYAAEVLSAYAVTIILLVLLVGISLLQSRRTKEALRKVEQERLMKQDAAREVAQNG